jgi:hypothetical protein
MTIRFEKDLYLNEGDGRAVKRKWAKARTWELYLWYTGEELGWRTGEHYAERL